MSATDTAQQRLRHNRVAVDTAAIGNDTSDNIGYVGQSQCFDGAPLGSGSHTSERMACLGCSGIDDRVLGHHRASGRRHGIRLC